MGYHEIHENSNYDHESMNLLNFDMCGIDDYACLKYHSNDQFFTHDQPSLNSNGFVPQPIEQDSVRSVNSSEHFSDTPAKGVQDNLSHLINQTPNESNQSDMGLIQVQPYQNLNDHLINFCYSVFQRLHLTDVTVEIIIRDNQNNVFTGKYTTFDQNSYQTDMNLISSNPVQPDQTKNVNHDNLPHKITINQQESVGSEKNSEHYSFLEYHSNDQFFTHDQPSLNSNGFDPQDNHENLLSQITTYQTPNQSNQSDERPSSFIHDQPRTNTNGFDPQPIEQESVRSVSSSEHFSDTPASVDSTAKKRGRPIGSKTKNTEIIPFGNKLVLKCITKSEITPEYKIERAKNNESVRKNRYGKDKNNVNKEAVECNNCHKYFKGIKIHQAKCLNKNKRPI